jgi:hypothetical protein
MLVLKNMMMMMNVVWGMCGPYVLSGVTGQRTGAEQGRLLDHWMGHHEQKFIQDLKKT